MRAVIPHIKARLRGKPHPHYWTTGTTLTATPCRTTRGDNPTTLGISVPCMACSHLTIKFPINRDPILAGRVLAGGWSSSRLDTGGSGISLKTQELYALVFLARYLDLFTDFISVYNTMMKVVFIVSSLAVVWSMRLHPVIKCSYDKELDTFRYYLLVLGSFVLALLIHDKFTVLEVFWAFSIYLEAVAILPQLFLLQRSGNVDNLAAQYVFFLGAYRAFYIVNWIYRYFTEPYFSRWIACVSGLVQTALCADFFYYYFISWKNNSNLKFPA